MTRPPETGPRFRGICSTFVREEDRCAQAGSPTSRSSGSSREYEAGAKLAELCRRHNVSPTTFYKWRAKYGGMAVSDAKRLRALEEENRRLKQLLADTMLDNQALKGLLAKNW